MSDQKAYDLDELAGLIQQSIEVLSSSPEMAGAIAQIAQAGALLHVAKSAEKIASTVKPKNGVPFIQTYIAGRGGE